MTIPKRLDYMILVNWIKRCIYLTESRWCHFHRKAVLPNLQWAARAALRVVCQVFRYHRTRTWRAWTRLAETCNAEAPPCASRTWGKLTGLSRVPNGLVTGSWKRMERNVGGLKGSLKLQTPQV